MSLGNNSRHNGDFKLKGPKESFIIGKYCALGEHVRVISINHDYNFPAIQGAFYSRFRRGPPAVIRNPPSKERTKGPIKIGNDVWVGDNVVILSGVTIGDGACIGAQSVITKDVEPFSIVGGVPAKHIKYRYSKEMREFLEDLKWWDWTDEKIKKNEEFFYTDLNKVTVDFVKKMLV